MDKQTLLETLRIERLKWRALMDALEDDAMTTPNVVGVWSVKDALAHVAFWERWLAYTAMGARQGRTLSSSDRFGRPIPPEAEALRYEAFDAWLVAQTHDKPLEELQRVEGVIYRRLVAAIEALDEDTYTHLQPQHASRAWLGDQPLWVMARDLTWARWREYGDRIKAVTSEK